MRWCDHARHPEHLAAFRAIGQSAAADLAEGRGLIKPPRTLFAKATPAPHSRDRLTPLPYPRRAEEVA